MLTFADMNSPIPVKDSGIEPIPLKEAVDRIGGASVAAWFLGVDASLVRQWLSNVRPLAEWYCPALEFLSGVRCESLRPELHWLRDEAGDITGHVVKFQSLSDRFPRLAEVQRAEVAAR